MKIVSTYRFCYIAFEYPQTSFQPPLFSLSEPFLSLHVLKCNQDVLVNNFAVLPLKTLTDCFWRGLEFSAQDVPTDNVHGFGRYVHYMMFFVKAANTAP